MLSTKNRYAIPALVSGFMVLAASPAFAADFGDVLADGASGQNAAASAVKIGGSAELSTRAYLGGSALGALGSVSETSDSAEAAASARVDLSYAGEKSEVAVKLRLDPARFSEYPADLIDEAYARAYLSDFTFEAGKMKVVWGKGDKLHVLDLFNANDYTDFIFPDYLDRRIGEAMLRGVWNAPSGALRLEAVWTPFMTADRNPLSGKWESADAKTLSALAESYVSYMYLSTYTTTYASTYTATGSAVTASAAASAAGTQLLSKYSSVSALLPDLASLDYGQYGLRASGTIGPVDVGVSYYLGHYKTPSAAYSYSAAAGKVTSLTLTYDRLQSFGAEAAMALGPVNFRFEGAYYLTDDTDGDKASVHNNSLNWLGGFDVDIPLHNLNLNVQTIGSYVLGGDGVTSAADVDYDAEGLRTNDKLVVQVSDSFANEHVKPSVKALWSIEHGDVVVMPEVLWMVRDTFSITFSGAVFACPDDGEFAAYKDNSFARIVAKYEF